MLPTILGTLLILLATAYALAALFWRARVSTAMRDAGPPQPVSVLKPLCGLEPRLERNLSTLCLQTHPHYQLVFGVRDPGDPAIAVVERLRRRFPALDIGLVIDPRVHGRNLKVSNLANMLDCARHPWLVIADSDIVAGPDYLERVTAPLHDRGIGIVTCQYYGCPVHGFWPRVGALFIDTWFMPSVRVASRAGSSALGFGATIALRLETLQAIGGFPALKDRLADDFWLGELTRRIGLRTVLSDVWVGTDVFETRLGALWSRERRWMQTIRSLNPPGYAFSFVTFTLPMLVLGVWLAPWSWNWALAGIGAAARLALHRHRPAPGVPAPGHALLAPLRDGLLLLEWLSGFLGTRTRWRSHVLPIDPHTRTS